MATRGYSPFSFFLALIFFAPLASACFVCGPKPTMKSPPPKLPPPKLPPPNPTPKTPTPNPVCPIDALTLTSCADILGGLVAVVIGTPPTSKCCTLLEGLVDWEAAVCICTAIKAGVLGVTLDVPVALSLLVDKCNKTIPDGYECA